jgi:DNA-binding response OmpR family regulator
MSVHRVLIVDDDLEVRRMVAASLKTLDAQINVMEAPSAEEALFISASYPLDLVVLDFRLPGMSGLDMLSRLRKRKPGIKIILVTGVEDAATRKQVSEAGAEAYFFKPIEIAGLLEAVRRCLYADQSGEPGQHSPPAVSAEPSLTGGLVASKPEPVTSWAIHPSLDERLALLKKRLRATTVLLVNEAGQMVEMAGNPSQVTSGSHLLPALMDAYRASLRVSDALGVGHVESLQVFSNARQCIFLAPVSPSNALLVVTPGGIVPETLTMVSLEVHQAVQELQVILDQARQAEKLKRDSNIASAPPQEVIVDQATMAEVSNMFAQAPQKGSREQAEGYWESLGENGMLDRRRQDGLSYDEA